MERIRQLRNDKGLSQAKLAVTAGMDPATLNRLEQGKGNPNLRTLERVADALEVEVADLLGKAQRRSSPEPSLFNGLEGERRLRYLRAWRAFVYRTADRWEEQPPTSREVATLFDTMTALVEQGVFDDSDVSDDSEQGELMLIAQGFKWLNAIADSVEKDEEAEQRRATFTLIQENIGA